MKTEVVFLHVSFCSFPWPFVRVLELTLWVICQMLLCLGPYALPDTLKSLIGLWYRSRICVWTRMPVSRYSMLST